MSKKYHDGKKHLVRIVQHIERIMEYVVKINEKTYSVRGMEFDAINKQIDLLGEQVSKLFDSTDNIVHHFPDVPWAELRALRNRIAHDYFSINPEMVWNFISVELDDIKRKIRSILLKRYGVSEIPAYLK